MKAQLWKIKICNSILDYTHGFGYEIYEIYIPKMDVCINNAEDKLHCFKRHEERYNDFSNAELIKELDFSNDIAEYIESYLKNEEKISVYVKKLFKSIKKKS